MSFNANVRSLPEAVIGVGAIRELGRRVLAMGRKRAFIVTDKGVSGAGITKKVAAVLEKSGIDVVLFEDVQANPTFSAVQQGIASMGGSDPDLLGNTVVVSLGGGSSMDAAKAMAVIAPDGGSGDIAAYCMNPKFNPDTMSMNLATMAPKRRNTATPLPVIAIPTTSGTASETNGAAVLTDEAQQRKLIFSNPGAAAALTILDPELTLALPAYPTATCGMDALTHAIEAFTSNRQNPYSDAIALGTIKAVAKWLPILMKDLGNLEARLQIQTASHMAGAAFSISGLGIAHALGHPLSALLHQAHGQTLSTMLPHVMEFNLPARADKYAEVAKAFGVFKAGASDQDNARAAIDAVAKLSIEVGTARSISDMNRNNEDIDAILEEAANQAMTDICILSNPVQATRDDVLEMYRKAVINPHLYPSVATVGGRARM